MDHMCKCFSMLLFKSCSKRKAEWGERNIWLHSTGDQFHKFWRLHNGEKGSLAGLAEGECWQHTKQHDPNELENPWPSRGLSRCYRHKKRYCFIEFRLPSLSLTRGKTYYLTIKASKLTWSIKPFQNYFALGCRSSTPHWAHVYLEI